MQGGAYVPQLINMYTETIGSWAKMLVATIAFLCMYGTVTTCADGYGRTNSESLSLILTNSTKATEKYVVIWTVFTIVAGYGLIAFFLGQMAALLKFAMISAFVTAPIFAYLNYALVKKEGHLSTIMKWYALAGIVFLTGFTVLFLLQFFGMIG